MGEVRKVGEYYEIDPDWTVQPGAMLEEWMEENGVDVAEIAKMLGISEFQVQSIIDGVAAICDFLAVGLEVFTGISSRMWLRFEENYRNDLAAGKKVID